MTGPKLTETKVTALLREKHTAHGNGGAGEHAFLAQVRNGAGFNANRTFDAVAVNLWPSRGLTIEVFEVKVSRSDWQRELKKPDKAEDACRIADRFTIVAPAGCVREGELPPTWGLIEVTGDGTDTKPWKLRTKKVAPLLHDDKTRLATVPRGLLVGMLRSAPGAVPGGRLPSPDEVAIQKARAEAHEAGRIAGRAEVERATGDRAEARKFLEALRSAGVDRYQAEWWTLTQHADGIAKVLKGEDIDRRIARVRTGLQQALDALGGAA